jgi:hypothetical protein
MELIPLLPLCAFMAWTATTLSHYEVSGVYCDEIYLSMFYAIQHGHCAFGSHPKSALVNSPTLTSTQWICELLRQERLAFSQNPVSFISKCV